MNVDMMKGAIRASGRTQRKLAQEIGLSTSRLNAKINGKRGAAFTVPEIKRIEALLELTPESTYQIFLG